MGEWAGWVAPAATMIAAMMTAANLGARLTGWGFVVFTFGSIAWTIVGLSSGQSNLVLTNGFLTIVNLVGIWRWLGRQAKFEDGSKAAAERSAARPAPSLFSAASLGGSPVRDAGGEQIGTVVDAMLRCAGRDIAYVVIRRGGVAGVGETLHALDPATLTFAHGEIRTSQTADAIAALPPLPDDEWPEALPTPSITRTPSRQPA